MQRLGLGGPRLDHRKVHSELAAWNRKGLSVHHPNVCRRVVDRPVKVLLQKLFRAQREPHKEVRYVNDVLGLLGRCDGGGDIVDRVKVAELALYHHGNARKRLSRAHLLNSRNANHVDSSILLAERVG